MSNIKPLILAVTTMNTKALGAVQYFSQYANKNCQVYISHQITDGTTKPLDIKLPYVHYSIMYDQGLSKNRNNILNQLEEGIYIVCDDDIQRVAGFEKIIRQAYQEQSADCITFQTRGKNGLRKKYTSALHKHNSISILSVSSIEISFDIKAIKQAGISFNQDFGLGTTYPSGEENIFLKDCLEAGLICYYYPAAINHHHHPSSGNQEDWGKKRPLFKHMYGNIYGAILWQLSKRYKKIKK